MGLTVIALTSKTVADDTGKWHHMDRRMYNVILAFSELLLGPRS